MNANTIKNCVNKGMISGELNVGGIIGSFHGVVSDCHNAGTILSPTGNSIGGIAGTTYGSGCVIQRCSNTGSITASYRVVGIIGYDIIYGVTINNCYNTADIIASANLSYVGGIFGSANHAKAIISYCYSTGTVTGLEYVGGIIGVLYENSVSNCIALNSSVKGAQNNTTTVCRIGAVEYKGLLSNNSALDIMQNVTPPTGTTLANKSNGADVSYGTALTTVFSGWNNGVWNIPSEPLSKECALPRLINEGNKPTITQIALSSSMFNVNTITATFTGGTITKTITSSLLLNTDYTVSYINNTNVGIATITINGIGDYKGTLSYTFTISKAPAPTITWPTSSALTYGDKLSASTLTGGSTHQGSFTWTNASTVPNVTNSGYSVTFTPNTDIEKNYLLVTPNPRDVAVTVTPASMTFNAPTAKNIKLNSPLAKFIVDMPATGSSVGGEAVAGTLAWYNSDARTAIAADADVAGLAIDDTKTLYWTFTPSSSNYVASKGQTTFTIVEGDPQPIQFATPDAIAKIYGDEKFTNAASHTPADATKGAITYASSDESVATVSASGEVTILKAGTTQIKALAAAVPGMWAQSDVSYTLTVNKKSSCISRYRIQCPRKRSI